MPNTFKARLKALPMSGKLVLLGSLFAGIGTFLPWYSDIDRFKIGDTFLGVTGPLYLAGLIVFVSCALSFGFIFSKLMNKRLPKMGFTEASTHMVTSGLALLMLVLSASVFFHSKFGLNLTDKTAGIGLMFGFVGSGVMLLGAVLMRKQKEIDFDDHLEPLIDISNDDRERGEVHHEPETVREPVRREIEKEDSNVDRSQTIEQAMKSQRVEIPDPPTKAWNQVHESINGMHGQRHSDTKDIS